jgi:hypothetical protein
VEAAYRDDTIWVAGSAEARSASFAIDWRSLRSRSLPGGGATKERRTERQIATLAMFIRSRQQQ